ncbi:MAG: hypothetical protein LBH69_00255, partial [Methanomassiliicoccaceae archaeon]|nr:hypothetical protein [Methanomassiliicoccaceae archaeon]
AVSNTTLDGRDTKVGRQCTKCPYHTGPKRRTPGRYTFSKGGSAKKGMSDGDRISMIRDAEKLMMKAASMIESATKGTEYERRGKGCSKTIKRTMISKKDGNSLNNIIKDIGAGGPQGAPSSKNTKLKDI